MHFPNLFLPLFPKTRAKYTKSNNEKRTKKMGQTANWSQIGREIPEFLVFVVLRIVLETNLPFLVVVSFVWLTIVVRLFVISSIVDLIWSWIAKNNVQYYCEKIDVVSNEFSFRSHLKVGVKVEKREEG